MLRFRGLSFARSGRPILEPTAPAQLDRCGVLLGLLALRFLTGSLAHDLRGEGVQVFRALA
ncbi:MAG TPA: hypothetical protein VGL18_12190 [Actinomycetota bacterium]|jgi:hypothetical protein